MKPLRGISPVVATALLVLIAVAVSVLLYTWVSGTVSSQPTSSPGLQERLIVDSVSYDNTNNKLIVYVRNVGNAPANLSAVYVINASSGDVIAVNNSASTLGKVQVLPGNATEIVVNLNDKTLSPGSTVIIKVVTREGTTATYVANIRG